MAFATNSIIFRIEWCRRQRTQAQTQPEVDGWRAEEEGLRDALLDRDHTDQYRCAPSTLRERYVMGFQDGRALIRASLVELY